MAELFVIIGQGALIEDISIDELRDMAAGEKTHVRAEQLEDLVGLMRCDGVEIVSADRGSVSGLAAS